VEITEGRLEGHAISAVGARGQADYEDVPELCRVSHSSAHSRCFERHLLLGCCCRYHLSGNLRCLEARPERERRLMKHSRMLNARRR